MTRQKTLFPEPEPEPDFPPPRDDDPSTWLITMQDDEHGAAPWKREGLHIVDSNGFPVATCNTVPNAMLIEVAADLYELVEDWSYRNKCRCAQPECRKCKAARIVKHVRGEQ